MAFDEDVGEFFGTDDFAVVAVYRAAANGKLANVAGIFDRGYASQFSDVVEDSTPVFTCRADDVPNLAHGDVFTIDGTSYVSRENEPDVTGLLVRIRLQLQ